MYQKFLGKDDNLTSEQLLDERRPVLDPYVLEQILLQVPNKRELNILCRARNFREICRRPDFRREWQMLHTGFPLQGHTNWARSVAWSPDSTKLANGSDDRSIRIWNVETAESIATLQGHTDPVYSVAWSPDGTKLASGSKDYSIRIWDVEQRSSLLPSYWGLIYK